MSRKLTTEEFVQKAREVHGDKYDYSKVEYKGATTKICIICPEHGEFEQKPCMHLYGNGCFSCGVASRSSNNRSNNDIFIRKSREVHGDKYDYSKVEYKNATTKVCIICREDSHGEFFQVPSSHLRGVGCPLCGITKNKGLKTTKDFIKDARRVHGGKYDYSKVEYKDSTTKVCIICNEKGHGEFYQVASTHLQGSGCPKCANRDKIDTKRFIEKSREVHGDKYDYSKVEYKSCKEKVPIICIKHG